MAQLESHKEALRGIRGRRDLCKIPWEVNREFKFDFQYEYRYQQAVTRMRSGQQTHKAVCIGSRDNRSRLDFGSREYTTGLCGQVMKIRYFMDFFNCICKLFVYNLCLSRL